MPPRDDFPKLGQDVPQEVEPSSSSGDEATQSTQQQPEAKIMMQPSLAKSVSNTFHWEMNFYCACGLAVAYLATPVTHRVFWHVLFALLSIDAARYYYLRGHMAGVPYTLPFINLIAMIINPERFWAELGTIAMASKEGLCANTMVCNQVVFCTDPDLCRKVMVGEDEFGLYAHPNAIWLFDPKNLIYLKRNVHKKVRAVLTPALFSETALLQYARAQEAVCRRQLRLHAAECAKTGQPFDSMVAFRSLGAMSSQESFIGPYLNDELRHVLEQDILVFTMGFLSFPCPYVGGLAKALAAKERIESTVIKMVPKAREYVLAGNEPRCMMEHWCAAIVEAAKERGCKLTEVHGCTDDDIARCVLDFLFAAQDATNSGLVFMLDVMHAYPQVFDRCHAEVIQVCGETGQVADQVRDALPYNAKVANQLLHHKPPVPMVPHLCQQDTELAGHSIRKGTVVIPSITYSSRTSGHALEFLPERPDADPQFVKTVTFGAGQHKCPGRRYAESLLAVFLAVLAQEFTIDRVGPRPGPDEFFFFPTLFPSDTKFIVKERNSNNNKEDEGTGNKQ